MDDTSQPARRAYLSGIVLLLGAAVLWSISGALIKLIDDDGRGPPAVAIAVKSNMRAR